MKTKTKIKVEPHIPVPYRTGNTIIKEYITEKSVNGTLYRSYLVDYKYKNKKGSEVIEYGFSLKNETIRTENSHLTTSDLNLMNVPEIIEHIKYIKSDEYKEHYTESYFLFLNEYLSTKQN